MCGKRKLEIAQFVLLQIKPGRGRCRRVPEAVEQGQQHS